LEDLSATLFEQANEMVATERKEKAKLEERLKVLEERDALGQKRLEMVEAALVRIERVKKLLGQ
jgi:BMFP domain-containing protein YqiC